MRKRIAIWIGLGGAVAALALARPASADITVIGRYTFLAGDTATRASYFTRRRIRISTPDGREVIFDAKKRRITLVDHRQRLYWDGPLARADSIVDVADGTRWRFMLEQASDSLKDEWRRAMQFPADSIRVDQGFVIRKIAGYPCNQWTLRAGSYMSLERWVGFTLPVERFEAQTEDVVLAAVRDPVGRAIMSMYWLSQAATGLPLAATMTFSSPTQQGNLHWEAEEVILERVPESAWTVPAGYQRAEPAVAVPRDP